MPLLLELEKSPSPTLSKLSDSILLKESTEKLAKEIAQNKTQFFTALTDADAYIQLAIIGCAIALAWVVSLLIRRRLHTYIENNPPKHFEKLSLQESLHLITPILAFAYLGVFKPFADSFKTGRNLTEPFIDLTVAYFLARLVLLLVHTKPVANMLAFLIMLTAVLKVTAFTQITAGYLDSVAMNIGSFHISLLNLFNGVVMMVLVFWVSGAFSRWLERFLRRSSTLSYAARELTVKFFRIFIYFIALLVTLSALGVDLTAFAVFGGALGVGIGLGLQKITANFVSGITLLLEKSIKIGDLIEVGQFTGHVRELNIRYALVETTNGRDILIPNEELISSQVVNLTHTNRHGRIDVKVGVNYDADVQLVRRLMLEAATQHPRCMKDPAPNCFLREFADSSLIFLLVFWVADVNDGLMGPQSEVMMSILDKFRANGVDIPFPQRVVRTFTEALAND